LYTQINNWPVHCLSVDPVATIFTT